MRGRVPSYAARGWTMDTDMCISQTEYTHQVLMRTNIDIDDTLLANAMAVTGLTTKKATVEEALRRMVQRRQRLAGFADMAGLGWDGDLAAMRAGRQTDQQG